ncbi:MAG: UDP binding domain-containing protein [Nitrospira sp.]
MPDIINELKEYGIQVVVHDPLAEHEEAVGEYGLRLSSWDQLKQLDCIILAVAHREYLRMSVPELLKPLRKQRNNVVVDVKSVLSPRPCRFCEILAAIGHLNRSQESSLLLLE